MNALRFVIEGKGASTIVDGKDCPMEEGDLVITPGWTWHEHVHRGDAPIIWLDALDAPMTCRTPPTTRPSPFPISSPR
jgi:gentisate 1,2-dioxygenase